jgi:hypothetical protein
MFEFIGSAPGSGYFKYTGADGAVIKFTPVAAGQAEYWLFPDGTRLDFTYSDSTNGQLRSVFSNRGWAILIESASKACAVNTALAYVTSSSACPSDAQTVTYGYAPAPSRPWVNVLTSMTKYGATRTFGYASNDHVDCITDPGQSACRVQNTYFACPYEPTQPLPQPKVRRYDPVISQTDAAGRTYQYVLGENRCPYPSTSPNLDYRPFSGNSTLTSETAGGVTITSTAVTRPGGQIESFTDPLSRVTSFAYDDPASGMTEEGEVREAVYPEGNKVEYLRDARGNVSSETRRAKPGSGLPDETTTSVYPATCSNSFTCNKPTSVTDARGNTTAFTYNTTHGGVLTETGPAVNGIQAVKRYAYAQYYAWLKTSGVGYAPAAGPVWLLAEERACRTTATTGNACTGGGADEIVISYEYQAGNASKPSNLLLLGKVVSADGQSLRTCYGYDRDGNKIWETSPRAGLGNCQ